MRALLASPLGFLIGLSLGALGGGGSILAVPALVYVAGQEAQAATTTSLLIVGMAALVGIGPHWRAGRVRIGAGLVFGAAGIGGSLAGSALNARLDGDVLLLAFSVVMLVAAAAMWRRATRATPQAVGAAVADTEPDTPSRLATVVRVVLAGTGVGVLTGLFGVGGGFVVVPALVLALGFTMPQAVGTSLLVIVVNAVVALLGRVGTGVEFEWAVIVPFTASAAVGVLVGSRVADKVPAERLTRWFVFLLVGVALYTVVSSVLALVG